MLQELQVFRGDKVMLHSGRIAFQVRVVEVDSVSAIVEEWTGEQYHVWADGSGGMWLGDVYLSGKVLYGKGPG